METTIGGIEQKVETHITGWLYGHYDKDPFLHSYRTKGKSCHRDDYLEL